MADFTSTTHANFIPEVWSDEIVVAYEKSLEVSKAVKTTMEVGTGSKKGDILHFPDVTNLTAADIADDADIVGEAPTEGQRTVTLNKKKHASVYIQKHLMANLSKYDMRKEYTGKVGEAIARQMDTDVIATIEGIGSPNTQGATGASATDVTDAMIRAGMAVLSKNDVPKGDRTLIFYTDQESAILGIAKFVEQQSIGNGQPILTGNVINVYGMPTLFSTNLTQGGTTPDFHRNGFLIHKDAVILARPGTPDLSFDWIPRRKAFLLSADVLYGSASFRGVNNFVVIRTDQVA